MSKKYDLIVFDWDGTLFDSTALITRCIQNAVEDVGGKRPSHEQASHVIGLNLMEALAHAAPDVPREKYPQLGERYRHYFFKEQDDINLFDGVIDLLLALKAQHHWVTIGTGKSRKGLDATLAREVQIDGNTVKLASLFDGTRTADQTQGKPNPQMLFELMREFGVDAERTLMIGDTTHDLQMAMNAGVASVGVNYGAHNHATLASCHPLYIADSVAQLRAWFGVLKQ
ncbi:MAG: HAD-IA family hydrolase [Cytophagales bacterium]|nr:HAD-IA family hydrolase [Cytophagales bacterium]